LQLGVGYTVGYLVYTVGTLLTSPKELAVIPAILGGIAVGLMALTAAVMIGKANRRVKNEKAVKIAAAQKIAK